MMELASLPTLLQNDMTVAHTCACHYVEQLFLRDRGFGEGEPVHVLETLVFMVTGGPMLATGNGGLMMSAS